MHKAPTVDYPVGRSRLQALALLVTGLGVAGVDVSWFCQAEVVGLRHWLGLAVSLAAAMVMLRSWGASPSGILLWDGRSWWWETSGIRVSGSVGVLLDFQGAMLLRFADAAGSPRWLWLEKVAAQTLWGALRRAVHARAQTEDDAGQTALAVKPRRQRDAARP